MLKTLPVKLQLMYSLTYLCPSFVVLAIVAYFRYDVSLVYFVLSVAIMLSLGYLFRIQIEDFFRDCKNIAYKNHDTIYRNKTTKNITISRYLMSTYDNLLPAWFLGLSTLGVVSDIVIITLVFIILWQPLVIMPHKRPNLTMLIFGVKFYAVISGNDKYITYVCVSGSELNRKLIKFDLYEGVPYFYAATSTEFIKTED